MANANTLTLPAESGEWSLPSRRKVGVIGLILTESALFTIFVTAYLFYIGKSATGPLSQARARSADSGDDLFAIQQRDSRAGGARLSTGDIMADSNSGG